MSKIKINIESIIYSSKYNYNNNNKINIIIEIAAINIAGSVLGFSDSQIGVKGPLLNFIELNSRISPYGHQLQSIISEGGSIYPTKIIGVTDHQLDSPRLDIIYQQGLINFDCSVEITEESIIIFTFKLTINNSDILVEGEYNIPFIDYNYTGNHSFDLNKLVSVFRLYRHGYLTTSSEQDSEYYLCITNHIFTPCSTKFKIPAIISI